MAILYREGGRQRIGRNASHIDFQHARAEQRQHRIARCPAAGPACLHLDRPPALLQRRVVHRHVPQARTAAVHQPSTITPSRRSSAIQGRASLGRPAREAKSGSGQLFWFGAGRISTRAFESRILDIHTAIDPIA